LEGAAFIRPEDDDSIPAWVIIVPIVVGLLIIIVAVVVLYFVSINCIEVLVSKHIHFQLGFFKLKKVDKDQDEEELNKNGEGVAENGEKPESSAL